MTGDARAACETCDGYGLVDGCEPCPTCDVDPATVVRGPAMRAALGAGDWPCDNYREPYTCWKVRPSRTAWCDQCRTRAPMEDEELEPRADAGDTRHDGEKAAVARLIDQHAPHGFAGVMRAPDDGCPVYVAAAALFDALGTCALPPGGVQ